MESIHSKRKRGTRIFVPKAFDMQPGQTRKGWHSSGTAIILLLIIFALLIGIWFAL